MACPEGKNRYDIMFKRGLKVINEKKQHQSMNATDSKIFESNILNSS